jgi:hypothetical protein
MRHGIGSLYGHASFFIPIFRFHVSWIFLGLFLLFLVSNFAFRTSCFVFHISYFVYSGKGAGNEEGGGSSSLDECLAARSSRWPWTTDAAFGNHLRSPLAHPCRGHGE